VKKVYRQIKQVVGGGVQVETIDTTYMSQRELYVTSAEATVLKLKSALKSGKYSIAKTDVEYFLEESGPALPAYDRSGSRHPLDVYPHDENWG